MKSVVPNREYRRLKPLIERNTNAAFMAYFTAPILVARLRIFGVAAVTWSICFFTSVVIKNLTLAAISLVVAAVATLSALLLLIPAYKKSNRRRRLALKFNDQIHATLVDSETADWIIRQCIESEQERK